LKFLKIKLKKNKNILIKLIFISFFFKDVIILKNFFKIFIKKLKWKSFHYFFLKVKFLFFFFFKTFYLFSCCGFFLKIKGKLSFGTSQTKSRLLKIGIVNFCNLSLKTSFSFDLFFSKAGQISFQIVLFYNK
jgi:hypothetical protein